jgi:hypothetical protein
MEQRGQLVQREQPVLMVRRALQELLVQLVLREQRVIQVHKVLQV